MLDTPPRRRTTSSKELRMGQRIPELVHDRYNDGDLQSVSGIILFDGTCAFCEGAVKFVARRDRANYFLFGASQSPQGRSLLAQAAFATAFLLGPAQPPRGR